MGRDGEVASALAVGVEDGVAEGGGCPREARGAMDSRNGRARRLSDSVQLNWNNPELFPQLGFDQAEDHAPPNSLAVVSFKSLKLLTS